MRNILTLLFITTGLATTTALAQTKAPAKPATKAATISPKSASTKPAVPKTSTTTKSTTTRTSSTTRPVSKPATQPETTATQSPPTTPSTSSTSTKPVKLEIPGVEPQKAPSFNKGSIAVNLGLGLGIGYGYGLNFGGSAKSSPALSLSVEKGLVDGIGPGVISVGGLLGYKSYGYEWSTYQSKWTNIYVAARGAYHYNFTTSPKIDTYAGLSLAARIESYSDNYDGDAVNGSSGTYLEVGIFAGGRYLLTEKLGVFTELGYDMSYMKLGVTAKF